MPINTPDDDEVRKIGKMSEAELLKYILDFPSVLSDSYYSMFRNAIYNRHRQLTE